MSIFDQSNRIYINLSKEEFDILSSEEKISILSVQKDKKDKQIDSTKIALAILQKDSDELGEEIKLLSE